MTEAEAKTKLCPYSFGQSTEPPHNGPWPCCASGCMAWRWVMKDFGKQPHPMMAHFPPYEPDYQPTDQGYCGLAGRP